MILDAEFRKLMPKLTRDEYSKLEQHIVNEGCRDALVLWDDILIDGYNRYEICTKHNIEFKTTSMQFDNREAVSDWIIDNQLGKRNLTVEQKNYLIGKKYKREKQAIGRPRGKRGKIFPFKKTAEKIAEEYKVTDRTVKNAEKFANAVDVIAENLKTTWIFCMVAGRWKETPGERYRGRGRSCWKNVIRKYPTW